MRDVRTSRNLFTSDFLISITRGRERALSEEEEMCRVYDGCGGETEHTVIGTLLSVSLCPWNTAAQLSFQRFLSRPHIAHCNHSHDLTH